jgi:excisionase family DNA binding protein
MAVLLKLHEAAQELGISEPTVRRYVKAGKLPSMYLGGRYMIRREDIEKFLHQAEVRPGENLPKGGAPSSTESGRDKVRLGDLVSDQRLDYVHTEINRLFEQRRANEINEEDYKVAVADILNYMVAAAERASKAVG